MHISCKFTAGFGVWRHLARTTIFIKFACVLNFIASGSGVLRHQI
ncbi:hypothetical protein CAMSH0001_0417 [Campylobacter showae RM3277]|uniref:Uncharacterized protein n=1 Tax=Campylobacter showae RM3277 TaxID=553219 RepID=C6RFB1_9BACT|nr:hypothetical protein CAMSH0001_0417 [Campylobacter showae RM3277]